jgi:hypothetical protein
MLEAIKDWLFGNWPVSFHSDYSLPDSIERLRAAVKPHVFATLFRQAVVGPISGDSVRLQRLTPLSRNSFKPMFYGEFVVNAELVELRGRFTMSTYTTVFMTVWTGFAGVWTLMALGVAISTMIAGSGSLSKDAWIAVLFGIGFVAFGCGLMKVGWWLSRKDIGFLSRTIQDALTK